MMKLIVERNTDRVLGCHMVGLDSPEIIQGFGLGLKTGAAKARFNATIGIHPSKPKKPARSSLRCGRSGPSRGRFRGG